RCELTTTATAKVPSPTLDRSLTCRRRVAAKPGRGDDVLTSPPRLIRPIACMPSPMGTGAFRRHHRIARAARTTAATSATATATLQPSLTDAAGATIRAGRRDQRSDDRSVVGH